MARVVALANQKGGVAKTTSTVNLGVALRELGYSVLAVDMDPQANLTTSQGILPDDLAVSMFNVLVQNLPLEQVIHQREIDVAAANIDLAGAELALAPVIGRERALTKALLTMERQYDMVLIDTPPSLGLLTINALTASDAVIVPVQCEFLSMRGLAQLQRTLEQVRENLNPQVHIMGILPTLFDKRTTHGNEAVKSLRRNFGDLVFNTVVRKTIKFAEAPMRGCSVLTYAPQSEAAQAYRDLAREVLNGKAI
ncbi:MAG: ParA family protein [Gaiellales bacterium]|mgnify:CR=1 FL=1|nr:ParA family protein [Gaiellales bacterium]